MSDDKKHDIETTGHSWDGIEEFNNPLPRWWVWVFYATIVWGIGYTIAYPAWPLLSGATRGVLGASTRADVAAEIQHFKDMNASLDAELASADMTTLASNADLHGYAINSGAATFRTWCAQCHGSGAAGAKGYPNLLDNDWLWGGNIEEITATVRHGVRAETDDDTRFSQMPAFGDILEKDEITSVVAYARSLSGLDVDATAAAAGQEIFVDNCAACHTEAGTGDREQGAPNLTDAIWLYGSDVASVTDTVKNARYGVMPSWGERLGESQVRAVAAYVHQLGGGE